MKDILHVDTKADFMSIMSVEICDFKNPYSVGMFYGRSLEDMISEVDFWESID